jgi:hypothetical protein
MSMLSTKDFIAGALVALAGVSAQSFSSPAISVDSANFDLGMIHSGKVQSVKHAFKIKNTGDSVLVIKQVKPG